MDARYVRTRASGRRYAGRSGRSRSLRAALLGDGLLLLGPLAYRWFGPRHDAARGEDAVRWWARPGGTWRCTPTQRSSRWTPTCRPLAEPTWPGRWVGHDLSVGGARTHRQNQYEARRAAGENPERLMLTAGQEAAYHQGTASGASRQHFENFSGSGSRWRAGEALPDNPGVNLGCGRS